jgi:hypothetical protein
MTALLYSRYRRATTHIVDSDIFIVTRSTIKHLNAAAAVVWLAIEEPATRRDILEVLIEVFPTIAPSRLGRDLDRLLRDLRREGLVVPHAKKEK